MIAILDNIRSVHNVGSMFRTADGAGITKIYCCGVTPIPLDRLDRPRKDFAKVSLGAEKSILWEHTGLTAHLLRKLKKEGYTIVAVEQHSGSVSYTAPLPKRKKIALVMGNEVSGLSKAILSRADHIVEIPMRGRKESLNVSVAFGIVAYHFAGKEKNALN